MLELLAVLAYSMSAVGVSGLQVKSRKLALWSVRELSFTNYFLGSSVGETKAHGLKRPQIKGFKGRRGGGGRGSPPLPLLCLI